MIQYYNIDSFKDSILYGIVINMSCPGCLLLKVVLFIKFKDSHHIILDFINLKAREGGRGDKTGVILKLERERTD
jgi:hypothetical protein